VLLREREGGPWLLFAAVVTETAVTWDANVSGARYGIDSPTGGVDDTPNATAQPGGSLALGDLGPHRSGGRGVAAVRLGRVLAMALVVLAGCTGQATGRRRRCGGVREGRVGSGRTVLGGELAVPCTRKPL
jgi:hypothetical protein